MRKICKVLFVLILLFVGCIKADAATLNMRNITLECIYSDGGLYTSAFSGVDEDTSQETFIVNRTAYNLAGVDNKTANAGSASIVINNLFVDTKCQETLYTLRTPDKKDEDEPMTLYKFGSLFTAADEGLEVHPWGWGSSWIKNKATEKLINAINDYSKENSLKYNLVSERYILGSDAPDPNAIVYYKQEAEQVAGKASFVSIMVYDNVILMKKNDRVTRLEGDYTVYQGVTKSENEVLSKEVPEKIYINNPEPEVVSNSSANVSNRFQAGQKTFSVSKSYDSIIHTQEYVLTDEIPDDGDGRGNALCDEILVNTSPYLKYLIKAMQILVPVFLIVLTAFDIGKIVLTGNIEEELPKRKKIIIVRFIVAIVFFFLPAFISLFTTWLIESGAKNVDSIEYIDCLFR